MTPSAAWLPTVPDETRVGRFMAAHGIASIDELRARSTADPAWFWPAVIDDLGIRFSSPWSTVVNTTAGIPWAKWFEGATVNVADQCVDLHAETRPDDEAVVWEGEDGTLRRLNWAELRAEVDGVARLFLDRGVQPGDVVGIYLPMVPETVAAVLAIAKIGAVFLPMFSGYGADAIRIRLEDSGAVALITADGFLRRGKDVDMLSVARAGAPPAVETIVVVPRLQTDMPDDPRLYAWPQPSHDPLPSLAVDSEHPLFIAYTSGTTGRPKGSVHVHGGFLVKVAEEVAYQFDVGGDDTLFWFTDMGWIMGPWEVIGGLANGATVALYEGAPDVPGPDRLWDFCARHGVTVLGMGPTLVRSLMPHGEDLVRRHDLSRLRILGSTGEPWNEDPWWWYFRTVGNERCPIINISGGTEIGACFLSPHPVEPLAPMSLGGPALGMAVDVYDDNGEPVREAVGELVCTAPWPAMTRGLYRDADRYIETYWSRWPNVWVHGDWASIDDGQWFLHGRSDDTIKVAGKRLGPAEVETVVVAHPRVVEAAAIGMPDETKGESLWVYAVVPDLPDGAEREQLRAEVRSLVIGALGKAFAPAQVKFTRALPKTRNAKILRRAIRSAALGTDPGDLSSLEDSTSLHAIETAL